MTREGYGTNREIYNVEDGYYALRQAVVEQAMQDYKKALRKLEKYPSDNNARYSKREGRRFFRSEWFNELTGIADGDKVIKHLEVKTDEKKSIDNGLLG